MIIHENLAVHFFDLSSQLLLSDEALKFDYPHHLSHLKIDYDGLLTLSPVPIQDVQFSQTSLQCAIVFSNGDVDVWSLGGSKISTAHPNIDAESEGAISLLLPQLRTQDLRKSAFRPMYRISRPDSTATATVCALSDIGAYRIVDYSKLVIVFQISWRWPTATVVL